jgi:hypothetical protein
MGWAPGDGRARPGQKVSQAAQAKQMLSHPTDLNLFASIFAPISLYVVAFQKKPLYFPLFLYIYHFPVFNRPNLEDRGTEDTFLGKRGQYLYRSHIFSLNPEISFFEAYVLTPFFFLLIIFIFIFSSFQNKVASYTRRLTSSQRPGFVSCTVIHRCESPRGNNRRSIGFVSFAREVNI